MKYAWIEEGRVVNLIWLYPGNEEDFPACVPCGDVPVRLGDCWDGRRFLRDGQPVLTPVETLENTVAELDAALLEAQYQILIGGIEQ